MRCGQSSDPWKPPESLAPMGDSTLSVAGQHEPHPVSGKTSLCFAFVKPVLGAKPEYLSPDKVIEYLSPDKAML